MQKLSNRKKLNQEKVTKSLFNLDEAISLVKKTSTANFIETIELHANLNINAKQSNQQLRSNLTLPHNFKNKNKIALLVPDNLFNGTEKFNVDIVGNDSLIEDIQKGIINFNLLITTPDMMPKIAKLGKILGPKGLMPSPKAGTVTSNINETLKEFQKGRFEYKTDKMGIAHISFGKSDFNENDLKENLIAVYKSIKQNRPLGIKGKYFKKLFICSTMGPSIEIDIKSFY